MSLDLDQLIADLPELEPPLGLKHEVLACVQSEMAQSPADSSESGRNRAWWYPALAMAAAILLMFSLPSDEIPGPGNSTPASPESSGTTRPVSSADMAVNGSGSKTDNRPSSPGDVSADESIVPLGNVEQMVQKGVGEVIPRVELKMSIETMDGRARIETDRSYEAGHRIYFRAWVDSAASLVLIRLTDDSSQTLKVQDVAAGEHDVMWNASEPLAWEIEPNEANATYILLAKARETVSDREAWESLVDGINWTYDVENPKRTCRSLSVPDVGCAAVSVRVRP